MISINYMERVFAHYKYIYSRLLTQTRISNLDEIPKTNIKTHYILNW